MLAERRQEDFLRTKHGLTKGKRDGSFLILEVQRDPSSKNLEVSTLVREELRATTQWKSLSWVWLFVTPYTVEEQPLKRDVYCVYICQDKRNWRERNPVQNILGTYWNTPIETESTRPREQEATQRSSIKAFLHRSFLTFEGAKTEGQLGSGWRRNAYGRKI